MVLRVRVLQRRANVAINGMTCTNTFRQGLFCSRLLGRCLATNCIAGQAKQIEPQGQYNAYSKNREADESNWSTTSTTITTVETTTATSVMMITDNA